MDTALPGTPRVGLVGYSAARTFHVPFIGAAGGVIAGVVTRDAERAASARADHPDTTVVPDLASLLALDLDVVVVATPSALHREHALQAIAAGVPCVVDKPLALNEAQAREVAEASEAAGVPVTVFHNRRYDPSFTTTRRLMDEGALGDVWRFEFRWERWRPVPKKRWREQASAREGGGLLLDLGPHLVDTALQLLGPARSVYAEAFSRLTPAPDDVFVSLQHTSGAVSHLAAGSTVGSPGPRWRVWGSGGSYVLDEIEGEASIYPDLANVDGHAGWLFRGEERTPVPGTFTDTTAFYRQVFAALRAQDPQRAMPVDPWEAVATAQVLDAALVSAESGQVVALG